MNRYAITGARAAATPPSGIQPNAWGTYSNLANSPYLTQRDSVRFFQSRAVEAPTSVHWVSGRARLHEATDVLINEVLKFSNFVQWSFGQDGEIARVLGKDVGA